MMLVRMYELRCAYSNPVSSDETGYWFPTDPFLDLLAEDAQPNLSPPYSQWPIIMVRQPTSIICPGSFAAYLLEHCISSHYLSLSKALILYLRPALYCSGEKVSHFESNLLVFAETKRWLEVWSLEDGFKIEMY